ncbi:hypothetical protein ACFP1Z_23170 [Streptomyces gamaensis]|uniref:Uncharacterized protein n=1 Tax=Streptomyces gamaensis TaxID=1763542 RepID=A0ABW0Z531_9ACTN
MPATPRLAATAVLAAALGAALWPAAGAYADDGGTRRDGRGTRAVEHQVQLPDGSRARLVSGDGAPSVTVGQGDRRRTLDGAHPAADLDRMHLRILGGDSARPTLRATLDGGTGPTYYDFLTGSARRTPDPVAGPAGHRARTGGQQRAGHHQERDHKGRADKRPHGHHLASSNPVKRVVEASEVIKDRHEIGTPAVAGAATLLAVGGGAYGLRRLARRRSRAAAAADGAGSTQD